MNKLKNFIIKFGSTFTALALILGLSASNSACRLFYFQNEVPDEIAKYK